MSCTPIYTKASNPYEKRETAVQKRISPFSKSALPFAKIADPFGCYELNLLLTETEGYLLLETNETIFI